MNGKEGFIFHGKNLTSDKTLNINAACLSYILSVLEPKVKTIMDIYCVAHANIITMTKINIFPAAPERYERSSDSEDTLVHHLLLLTLSLNRKLKERKSDMPYIYKDATTGGEAAGRQAWA